MTGSHELSVEPDEEALEVSFELQSSTRLQLAGMAALAGVAAGCGGSPATQEQSADPSVGFAQRGNPLPGRGLVVAISVDGLKPAALRRLGPRGAPAMHRMLRDGTSTLNARTLRESTLTLPNHTSMLTGRPAAGLGGHATTENYDLGGTVHQAAGHYVGSAFTVVHDHGGSTALYSSKAKFALFDRSWNARNGGRDRVGVDDGRDKIDQYQYASEKELVKTLLSRLRHHPDPFSFLHLALPDEVGHERRFASRPYLRAVKRIDALIGPILRTIAGRPGLRQRTTIILTADHGGSQTDHSDPTRRANFTIPFLVWGAGVADGADLYRLNPRRHPQSSSRTGYRGRQPIRNGDLANLATHILGLPPIPGSDFNHGQRLRVDR